MSNLVWRVSRVRAALFVCGLCATISSQADLVVAAQLEQAEITRIIREVQLLPDQGQPRPAAVKDAVRKGAAVRTGLDSRTELLFSDQTLARMGSNTLFSFNEGTRDMNLGSGVMLVHVPKGAGGAKIVTAGVTAAITGTTVLVEAHPEKDRRAENQPTWNDDMVGAQVGLVSRKAKSMRPKEKIGYFKFIGLEGVTRLFLNSQPNESVVIHAGEMLIVAPGATSLPKPVTVNLGKLVQTCLLITDFEPLASEPLIAQEIQKQQDWGVEGGDSPINTDPASGEVIDQAISAFPPGAIPLAPLLGTTITYLGLPAGNWSSIASWTPAIVPNNVGGKAYTAIINGGMLTQDIAPGVTIQQLQMNGGTLVLTNPLTLNNGLQFTGGTFSAGNLFIAGPSTHATTMTLQNVTLNNTGAYDITIASGFAFSAAGSNFINSGTLRKADGGMEEVFFNIPITNTGTVSVTSGALTFTGGGTNSGTFSAPVGGFLGLDSSFTFDASSNVTGAGTVAFSSGTTNIAGGYNVTGRTNFSGATVNFNSPITSLGAMTINGGAVNFNSTDVTASSIDFISGTLGGTAANVNSTGLFSWTGGTVSGVGAVNANGGMVLNGPANLDGSTLNNAAGRTATITGAGGLTLSNGAIFNNNGVFLAQNDQSLSNGGGGGMFNNNGTFTRNTSAGTFTVGIGVPFNNTGTVNVQTGTLALNSTTTSSGPISVSGGATLSLGGTFIQPAGAIALSSGNLAIGGNSMANLITGPSGMIDVTAAGSLTVANGFDFRGVNNPGGAGGTLILNAPSVTFGPAAINGAFFTGGDAAPGSGVAGGNGGNFTATATTGDIVVGTNIDASTGGNDAAQNGGTGGTVSLTSDQGTVTVNNRIQVSDTAPGRHSAAGGNIALSSGKNSAVAINVANSAQLLALLDGTAAGPGGLITISATSVAGNSQVNVAGVIRADRGGIDIRNANASGQITLSNAILMADVVKVATLGDSSTLNITSGTVSAITLLRLYAGSISAANNSTINFTGTVNLTGAQIDIAANTVTIGVGSTVMTSSQAHVYATVRNYDLGSGGNGTGGMFGGAGATSFSLLMAPPLGPPGGTAAALRQAGLADSRSDIRKLERPLTTQNSPQNRQQSR